MNHIKIDSIKKTVDNLIEQVFEEGFKQGSSAAEDRAYKKGLYDTWECVRKIVLETEDGGLSDDVLKKIIGDFSYNIIKRHHASEVIEKIKEWEDKQ